MDKKLRSLLQNTADIALRRRAKWIIEKLDPKKGEKILDLGCGDGFYLHLLSNLDLEIELVGSDYDKNALNSAQKNLNTNKIKLVQADLMKKLPFPNDYFDGIIMSEVLEHLQDDVKGMKEVRRILKKGGRVVLSVPNIDYPFFWDPINWIIQRIFKTHIKSGFWAGIWNQHLRLYSTTQVRSVLDKSGFKNIKTATLTHFCLPFNHHIINLGARILAYKKVPSILKKQVSKFNRLEVNKERKFNLFWVLFKFDNLNNTWDRKGGAISLVASATK